MYLWSVGILLEAFPFPSTSFAHLHGMRRQRKSRTENDPIENPCGLAAKFESQCHEKGRSSALSGVLRFPSLLHTTNDHDSHLCHCEPYAYLLDSVCALCNHKKPPSWESWFSNCSKLPSTNLLSLPNILRLPQELLSDIKSLGNLKPHDGERLSICRLAHDSTITSTPSPTTSPSPSPSSPFPSPSSFSSNSTTFSPSTTLSNSSNDCSTLITSSIANNTSSDSHSHVTSATDSLTTTFSETTFSSTTPEDATTNQTSDPITLPSPHANNTSHIPETESGKTSTWSIIPTATISLDTPVSVGITISISVSQSLSATLWPDERVGSTQVTASIPQTSQAPPPHNTIDITSLLSHSPTASGTIRIVNTQSPSASTSTTTPPSRIYSSSWMLSSSSSTWKSASSIGSTPSPETGPFTVWPGLIGSSRIHTSSTGITNSQTIEPTGSQIENPTSSLRTHWLIAGSIIGVVIGGTVFIAAILVFRYRRRRHLPPSVRYARMSDGYDNMRSRDAASPVANLRPPMIEIPMGMGTAAEIGALEVERLMSGSPSPRASQTDLAMEGDRLVQERPGVSVYANATATSLLPSRLFIPENYYNPETEPCSPAAESSIMWHSPAETFEDQHTDSHHSHSSSSPHSAGSQHKRRQSSLLAAAMTRALESVPERPVR